MDNEHHKKCDKVQCDNNVKPRVFSEGYLILLYDQESKILGSEKFDPMWLGPYIVKGAYVLVDFDGFPLAQPRNVLYLKKYYDYFFFWCS